MINLRLEFGHCSLVFRSFGDCGFGVSKICADGGFEPGAIIAREAVAGDLEDGGGFGGL